MSDFYNAPEDSELHRLETLASASQPLSYEFDMFTVWRDPETEKLYYAQDSGCSCPSPYEWVEHLSQLNELTSLDEFLAKLNNWDFSGYETSGRPTFVASKARLRTIVYNHLWASGGI